MRVDSNIGLRGCANRAGFAKYGYQPLQNQMNIELRDLPETSPR